MANDSFFHAWVPRLLSVLRIVAGFLLLQHGLQKVFGLLPMPPAPGAPPPPPFAFDPFSLIGVAGILEFGGGLLLLLGLFTRPVAFIMSGFMAVAYFMGHAIPQGSWLWPVLNRGELAVLYCFIFLYLAAAGGGPWSLDHLWWRGKASDYDRIGR